MYDDEATALTISMVDRAGTGWYSCSRLWCSWRLWDGVGGSTIKFSFSINYTFSLFLNRKQSFLKFLKSINFRLILHILTISMKPIEISPWLLKRGISPKKCWVMKCAHFWRTTTWPSPLKIDWHKLSFQRNVMYAISKTFNIIRVKVYW